MDPMPALIPKFLHLASATGTAREHKNARDRASRPVALARQNLVSVSSVLPPGIQLVDRDAARALMADGQIIHVIHGLCESNTPGQLVTATLSVAIPADGHGVGFASELFEWPGIVPDAAVRRTERMVLQLYAENHGPEDFDPRTVWEPGRTRYTLAGREVDVTTIQASGVVNDDGDWCCALAAAVLL
jgi:arginine decarboxylase